MAQSTSIAQLIHATLLASSVGVGCQSPVTQVDGDVGEGDDCSGEPTEYPFDVSQWNLTTEGYATLAAYLEDRGSPWSEFDDTQKCAVACAYAGANLDAYFQGYAGGYQISLVLDSCTLTISLDADVFVDGTVSCSGVVQESYGCLGRRPLGWTEPAVLDDYIDRCALLEQASVGAFLELAEQLVAHGAPREFVERCRAAAKDEARHVALMQDLGADVGEPGPLSATRGDASLVAIALHNAIEGCVLETWAALLARHQAEHAADERTRAVYAAIAVDEAEHAQLAWDLHRWFCDRLGQLDHRDAERVEQARARALAGLVAIATAEAVRVGPEGRRWLGLPDVRAAVELAERFAGGLAMSVAA